MKMYESPIKVFLSDLHTEQEGMILKAVQGIGVDVDKERLLKALAFDREQYSKGYEDCRRHTQEWISVKDRLPEVFMNSRGVDITETVIASDGDEVKFGNFYVYSTGVYIFRDERDYDLDATHWMPLPNPPEGGMT